MRPQLGRLLKTAGLAAVALAVAGAAFLALFFARCGSGGQPRKPVSAEAQARRSATADIAGYARPEVDTYLTYPEWYIVWSYQERADHLAAGQPSAFPYFGAIGQYWSGYCSMDRITRGRYPFNAGDHLMLVVIGTSFTVEYAIRGAYEKTVGRLSEWLARGQAVAEDRYAARLAQEYAAFVHIRPWYEFSFARGLKGLWRETALWGPHPLRSWERKGYLTADYALQAAYAWLIEQASHATYGIEDTRTYVWIEGASDAVFAPDGRVRSAKELENRAFIASLPRYQEFTDVAVGLAAGGAHFVEIAGNDEILLTAIVPRGWTSPAEGQVVFSASILSRPDRARVALRCPVGALRATLTSLEQSGVVIEHVYDY